MTGLARDPAWVHPRTLAEINRGAIAARRAVASLGGTARFTELIEAGATEHSLRAALREGALIRPHRGTYVVPGIARWEALAEIFRATATCVTRCDALGLPLLRNHDTAHLLVPRDRSASRPSQRPVAEVTLHRHDGIDRAYAESVAGAIDLAGACLEPREQLALVDAAARRGFLSAAQLRNFRVSRDARRAFLRDHMDARSESISETFARLALKEAGLNVDPQRSLIRSTRTDLVVENFIALEVDSKKHHADWDAQRADRSRDRHCH